MKKFMFLVFLVSSLVSSENKMQIFQPTTSTCPQSWLDDMKDIAKEVDIISMISVANLKNDIAIPREIRSCNTSFFNNYVFEGNVPKKAIKDFLENTPPNAIGLALPAYENDKNPKTVYILFENSIYKEFGKY